MTTIIRSVCYLPKSNRMFGLFKKKAPIDKLRARYEELMKEAFVLSKTDRKASDLKHAEADKVMKEVELMQENT